MGLCTRGWRVGVAGAGLAGLPRGGGPWRAWLSLRGQCWGRREESTQPTREEEAAEYQQRLQQQQQRWREEEEAFRERQNKTVLSYLVAAAAGMAGLAYASVPLYRLFCQVSGYGGTTKQESDSEKIERMEPIKDRIIKVTFNADVHATLNWNFRPQQSEIYVAPGETALAFYKAKNPTDKPIIGVSTYNVVPFEAGPYFNKIQCFCFEEQRLNPHEEVDMPVFFYIDPEIDENPSLMNVDLITLSYTFFESKGDAKWAIPGFQ